MNTYLTLDWQALIHASGEHKLREADGFVDPLMDLFNA